MLNIEIKSHSNSLAVAWAINSLAYSIVYPFIPIYLHSGRGIPMEQVGLIFPLMGLATILSPQVAGWLTDRFGRGFMMQFGQSSRAMVFFVLSAMALWEAPFWAFAAVLMINAGVGTFFQVAADSYLTDLTTPEERPRVYSKIRIGTNIGWALGPMLGAFLARTPFSLMFAMTAVLCILGTFYVRRYCGDIRRPVSEHTHAAATPAGGIWNSIGSVTVLQLLFYSFLLFLLTSQLYSILSVYSTTVVGVSRDTLGLVYSVNGFTIIFFQLPITRLLDKLKSRQSLRLLCGASLYAAGYFSLAFSANGLMLGLSVFILTLGEVVVQPALYTSISTMAPRGYVGRAMANLGLVRGVGFAVGPWIGAQVFARYSGSPVILWGLLSLFAVFAALGFLSLKKKL